MAGKTSAAVERALARVVAGETGYAAAKAESIALSTIYRARGYAQAKVAAGNTNTRQDAVEHAASVNKQPAFTSNATNQREQHRTTPVDSMGGAMQLLGTVAPLLKRLDLSAAGEDKRLEWAKDCHDIVDVLSKLSSDLKSGPKRKPSNAG